MKDPRYPIERTPQGYVLTAPGHPLTPYRRKRDALSHGVEHNRNRLTLA